MVRTESDLPTPETTADRRLLDDVAIRGWHVICVAPRGNTPGWAFSVGLHRRFAHPEVIVFGLPSDTLQEFVGRIASDVAGGVRYPPDATSDRIVAGYTCDMRPVAQRWYGAFLGYATWFYGGPGFPVLQCRWPDRENRLPEHPDFDADLLDLQPLLDRESTREARVEALLHALDVQ